MSWIVSASSQPIAPSASAVSGSVAIIDEFIGSSRRSPAADRRRVALRRADDPAGAHVALVGAGDAAGQDLAHRRALVDVDAHPLDGGREADREPRRLHARAVRRADAPPARRRAGCASRSSSPLEQPRVVLRVADRRGGARGARAAGRAAPRWSRPTASRPCRKSHVDALGRAHPPDLVDRVVTAQPRAAGRPRSAISPDTQPPLRPEAPYPATSRSRTAMRSDGSARFR